MVHRIPHYMYSYRIKYNSVYSRADRSHIYLRSFHFTTETLNTHNNQAQILPPFLVPLSCSVQFSRGKHPLKTESHADHRCVAVNHAIHWPNSARLYVPHTLPHSLDRLVDVRECHRHVVYPVWGANFRRHCQSSLVFGHVLGRAYGVRAVFVGTACVLSHCRRDGRCDGSP